MSKPQILEELSILTSETNPTQFFYEKISEAQKNQNVKLSENVEFYLVNLMCDQVRMVEESGSFENDCLALLLKKALESSAQEQFALFKKIGDRSLYVSGFFQEYFNNKTFGVDYYMAMGASAYGQLASLVRVGSSTYASTMGQIYQEMSSSFNRSVDILLYVSEQANHQEHERDLLSVYTAWASTKSSYLRKSLQARGINPVSDTYRRVQ